ncbi:glycosyltransferase [Haloferax mucosum ATCC BAA-1512]|uniref:Glycosyltransferase n=1 Tax=Haloferax mucosum ATCC BAA-1512 TaxID=662479 RepID=M0IPX9_9EURY|nr:glycosyltransferase family 4 protein [Haloferax mucosum]ELZ98901.1 glycosyltransferase [Haloferax mucosum ATCC BAA-1512]
MKILQVTPRYPPQSGGVETHVREVSERLVNRGHDVTVVTADAGGDGFHRERRNGVRVRRLRGVAPGGAMHICPHVARAVRQADADVVHAHNYHSFPLFFAALGVGDRRFVATPHYHGASASSIRDRLLSLYHPVGRWAVRRADRVVAVSDWERSHLEADFGVDATVIPNGLERDRFASATATERNRPYVLTVGRLEEYKGVQHAIRALSELPEYDLLVAGSGDYRDELEQIAARAGVSDRVEFLGYVADEDLPGLYAGAAAYVTLSEFEAYGMTVAEALTAGTPCVVLNAAALTDWTTEPGVVGVSDTESARVASAVREASKRTNPAAETVIDWDTVVERLLDVYA